MAEQSERHADSTREEEPWVSTRAHDPHGGRRRMSGARHGLHPGPPVLESARHGCGVAVTVRCKVIPILAAGHKRPGVLTRCCRDALTRVARNEQQQMQRNKTAIQVHVGKAQSARPSLQTTSCR